MNIFFDSKISSIQQRGGISRMVFELMRSLDNKKDVKKIFYRGLYVDRYDYQKEWFKKYYALKAPGFLGGRALNFLDDMGSKVVYGLNATDGLIYHSFYHRVPKNKKGPLVVHAYDMIQELFYHMPKAVEFKKKSFVAADLIIAISESTKNDLCRLYSINSDKVVVAHLGVDEIFFKGGTEYTNKRPYILYVGGRYYGYKNFDLLLDTFINKKYFLDFDLVLVGGEKELTSEQKLKVKQAGQGDWLIHEFGDDEILAGIYKNASVFIYPSLYEGFGIPPLEAMAAGCPVVASNASSIPEVVGDAGLLFDPKDANDLAEKIEKVINDKSLAADLILRGKNRAKEFTWDAMAEKVYQEYLEVKKYC